MNNAVIESACETFGIPIPDAVTRATALAATFGAVLDKAQSGTKPDAAGIVAATTAALDAGDKPGTIDKAITEAVDAILTYDERHAARLGILGRLVTTARDEVDRAWMVAVPSITVALGPVFDREAERFLTAAAECGDGFTAEQALASDRAEAWRTMTDAAARLSHLRTVRRELALAESGQSLAPNSPEDWSLVCVLSDGDTWARRLPVRLSGLPVGGREWWMALTRTPGVERLSWALSRAEAEARARETQRLTKPTPVARESVTAGHSRPAVGTRVPGPRAGARG